MLTALGAGLPFGFHCLRAPARKRFFSKLCVAPASLLIVSISKVRRYDSMIYILTNETIVLDGPKNVTKRLKLF